jgi:hypothetical protein
MSSGIHEARHDEKRIDVNKAEVLERRDDALFVELLEV